MQAPSLVLRRLQSNTMQHPLTGATCVALPNVGMCPQLSCALTFMYLQQVSLLNFAFPVVPALSASFGGFVIVRIFLCVNWLCKCLPLCGVNVVLAPRNSESEQKICFNRDSSFACLFFFSLFFLQCLYWCCL